MGSNGLDSNVEKSGKNYSVGEKQMICIARAILNKSKIVAIDEATANVDIKLVTRKLLVTYYY